MVDILFFFIKHVKQFLLKIGWNSDQIVPELSLPILYVTGDMDELVPQEMTLKLYELSKNARFKELLVIKNGTHNDSWYVGRHEYIEKLQKFIRSCITRYEIPAFDEWAHGTNENEMLDV